MVIVAITLDSAVLRDGLDPLVAGSIQCPEIREYVLATVALVLYVAHVESNLASTVIFVRFSCINPAHLAGVAAAF